MYDISEAEKARLRDMARAGYSVTDRDAELLRRVADLLPEPIEEPREYPKMVYPDGAVHDASSEPHLVGTPKGFLVNSREEEDEAMQHGGPTGYDRPSNVGVDPNASHGREPGRLAVTEEIQRRIRDEHMEPTTAASRQPWVFPRFGAVRNQGFDPVNDPRSGDISHDPEHSPDPTVDRSQDNQLGGAYAGGKSDEQAAKDSTASAPGNETPRTVGGEPVPGSTPTPPTGPIPQKSIGPGDSLPKPSDDKPSEEKLGEDKPREGE